MPGVFANPLPKPQIPRHHEGSRLRSPRDEDSLGKAWKKNEVASVQITSMQDSIRQLQWQISKTRAYKEQRPPGPGFFPFKIYLSPPDLYLSPPDDAVAADESWRTFRVRAGQLYKLNVAGTDGDGTVPDQNGDPISPNEDPDNLGIPAYNATTIDFTVDSGAITLVWIDNTDTAAPVIDYGTEEPSSEWWTDQYMVIASIDTMDETNKVARIRQFIRSDVFSAGGTECPAG